jgi:hypothetical protein
VTNLTRNAVDIIVAPKFYLANLIEGYVIFRLEIMTLRLVEDGFGCEGMGCLAWFNKEESLAGPRSCLAFVHHQLVSSVG